jgi:hypothetical protein
VRASTTIRFGDVESPYIYIYDDGSGDGYNGGDGKNIATTITATRAHAHASTHTHTHTHKAPSGPKGLFRARRALRARRGPLGPEDALGPEEAPETRQGRRGPFGPEGLLRVETPFGHEKNPRPKKPFRVPQGRLGPEGALSGSRGPNSGPKGFFGPKRACLGPKDPRGQVGFVCSKGPSGPKKCFRAENTRLARKNFWGPKGLFRARHFY